LGQCCVVHDEFSLAHHVVGILLSFSSEVLTPWVFTHLNFSLHFRASVPVIFLIDSVRLVALVFSQLAAGLQVVVGIKHPHNVLCYQLAFTKTSTIVAFLAALVWSSHLGGAVAIDRLAGVCDTPSHTPFTVAGGAVVWLPAKSHPEIHTAFVFALTGIARATRDFWTGVDWIGASWERADGPGL